MSNMTDGEFKQLARDEFNLLHFLGYYALLIGLPLIAAAIIIYIAWTMPYGFGWALGQL